MARKKPSSPPSLKAEGEPIYLVEKLGWSVCDSEVLPVVPPYLKALGEPDDFDDGEVPVFAPDQGASPLKAFTDAGKAEAHCKELEVEAWSGINPFRHGTALRDITSFDSGRL